MTDNTERIRYHSSDHMTGVGELSQILEPVAVVIRADGSLDVYGQVAIVDQRAGYSCLNCDREYLTPEAMNAHIGDKHPENYGEADNCVCCDVHAYSDRDPGDDCPRCDHPYGRHNGQH